MRRRPVSPGFVGLHVPALYCPVCFLWPSVAARASPGQRLSPSWGGGEVLTELRSFAWAKGWDGSARRGAHSFGRGAVRAITQARGSVAMLLRARQWHASAYRLIWVWAMTRPARLRRCRWRLPRMSPQPSCRFRKDIVSSGDRKEDPSRPAGSERKTPIIEDREFSIGIRDISFRCFGGISPGDFDPIPARGGIPTRGHPGWRQW